MNDSARLLLVIGYVWPEPDSSAAGRHMMSLIRLFQESGWDIHYASPAARGEHEVDLEAVGVSTHEIVLNCSSFDRFVGELSPEVVLFDRFMMEEQFGWRVAESCPQALRVLDMEDLHSLRQARQTAIKKGLEDVAIHTDLAKREVASIFRCDVSLVISDFEFQYLQEVYQVPRQLLVHCPFLLEPPSHSVPSFEERAHFISIGNFRHEPNWDAVLQLKQVIWPLIRQALPQAELHVYGAYPPPKATQLHQPKNGFLVKGWAEDACAVMLNARVCLAPLRFGAGLKGKLTEAMLCGTPSVTTQVGAEGIQGTLPWPGMVVEDAEAFAQAAITLYQDQAQWNERQQRGTTLLQTRFDKAVIGQRVMQEVETISAGLEEHRAQNFIGSMLQLNSMKATKYMSQWIEAKNK